MADEEERPILIKRVKKGGDDGHHGGAWKVAYADFTTAMMAFFMLLWLLNVSDKETLDGLADYFSPTSATASGNSGAGGVLGGTSMASEGAQSSGAVAVRLPGPPPTSQNNDRKLGRSDGDVQHQSSDMSSTINERESEVFKAIAEQIKQAIQDSPELAQHEDQVLIEETPDGMAIQIVDKDGRAMFRPGTANLYGYASRLIGQIGDVVEVLPNRVSIHGHTDAGRFSAGAEYTNWELSADRANSARRVLRQTGVSTDRFSEVAGKADTEPMFPDSPDRPENRRITVLVLREAPVVAPSAQ